MMKSKHLHAWELSPREAIALQKQLADQIVLQNKLPEAIKNIAGVDVSYKKLGNLFHAAIVVMDYNSLQLIETASASGEVNFPYIPGLLSFRELPILLQAFEQLNTTPDVVMADAQGFAHPRRLGLASHLGLWLNLPTIGCAKSRLCGEHAEPGLSKGDQAVLLNEGEEIGRVLRTKDKVKPMFVSPGHLIDMEASVAIVLHCCRGYRLPEPTRQAHLLSNRVRSEVETSGTR